MQGRRWYVVRKGKKRCKMSLPRPQWRDVELNASEARIR